MARQVVAALDRLPMQRPGRPRLEEVPGYGAGLIAIRWGSPLALWLDRNRPLHPALAGVPQVGTPAAAPPGLGESARQAAMWNRITDAEMARVNTQMSAGLAWLLGEGRRRGPKAMGELLAKAIDYLLDREVPEEVVIGAQDPLVTLSLPEIRRAVLAQRRSSDPGWAGQMEGDETLLRHRVSNLLVHNAWRPRAEAFHGGATPPLGVDHARCTRPEAIRLEHCTLDGMAGGAALLQHALGGRHTELCLTLTMTQHVMSNLAQLYMSIPTGWSDEEDGRAVAIRRGGLSGGTGTGIRPVTPSRCGRSEPAIEPAMQSARAATRRPLAGA